MATGGGGSGVGGPRALVVTTVHTPYDARIYWRQIAALLDAGFRVTYAAPWAATGTPHPRADRLAVRDLPRASGRRRIAALGAARRVLREEAAGHDVVVLHDPDLLLAVPFTRGLPTVVWDVHEDTAAALVDRAWMPAPLRPPARAMVRTAERWAERRVRLVLAEHGYAGRFARRHPVVPNVPPVPADRPAPSGGDRVVYVGRLTRSRGALAMLELGRRLAPEVTVELIGSADADLVPALRAATGRGEVCWRGFLPNPEALARMDGALAGLALLADRPNYRHSMPTKVLEYLSRGVPAIATPLPVAADLLRETGGGLIVPFEDIDAAEAAIRELRAHPVRRRAMAEAGHRAVLERYSWNDEGRRFAARLRAWAREPAVAPAAGTAGMEGVS